MPLVLANRVQETGTANTTVSFTLTGAVPGFQSFATIGNTNTTYYSATDTAGNWEVGLGTYSTTGPTLTRTTIYASSNAGSAVTFSGVVNVFVTYPSGRSVNLDASGNVSALGTVASGTWQGSTIGVAYGGTGVTASTGANSVVLRDANGNITVNRISQELQTITASGGTTVLTAASDFNQRLVGTGNHTFRLPDATTLTDTTAFQFNNAATGTLTIQDNATAVIGTVTTGGAANAVLVANTTVAGTWELHGYLPEGVTWGTNALALGTTVISGGTWQGGTIQSGYGGTGLTTFAGANNALYSTSASALAAGTLPIAAGGTGQTTRQAALDALAGSVTSGQYLRGDGTDVVMSAIQVADVPTLNQNTTGTAANVTGIVAVANGGTGTATPSLVAGTNVTISGSFPNQTINASGGGLTQFTAAESTTTPNATVYVDSLTAAAASTDADVAFVAKGTGATLAQVPDSTATGGNKRGTYATDFQKSRTNAAQVASGNFSSILGGQNNTASAIYTAVVGGLSNSASSSRAAIVGGEGNTATQPASAVVGGQYNGVSATNAIVAGGSTNSASGLRSAVLGGSSNTASGQDSAVVGGSSSVATALNSFVGGGSGGSAGGINSAVVGGQAGNTRSISGNFVVPASSAPITVFSGRQQLATLLLGRETTDATATILTSNTSAASTTNQVILPNNSAYYVKGSVIATVTGGGNTKSWDFIATIKRGANAAATSIVGAVTLNVQAADAGASTWVVAITADTTNGGLAVTVTGQASTTIRWVCKLETTEVTY
jgi:uncharacterized protein YhfF